ncbi:MAG: ferredoxin [Streptococcaceae bacterium]|nr:ferredoxin [Streptococcaceae bacterium]
MLKIAIFPNKCIACGICEALYPQYFDYSDMGIVRLAQTDDLEIIIPDVHFIKAIQAKCPTQAIKISRYTSQE